MSNIPSSNYNQTTQQPIAKPIAKPTGEWATGEPSKMNNRDWSGQVKPGLEHDPLTSTSTSYKALDSSISSGEARMDSDFGRQSGMGSHGYQSSTVPSTHSSTLGSSSGIGAGSVLVGSSLPTSHTTTTTTTTDHHKSGGLLNKIMHPHQSSASGSAIHSSTTSTTTTDHHKSGGMLSNILHPHHSSSTASTDLHSSTTSTTTTDHHKSGGMLSNLLHPHHSSASTSSDVSSSTTSDQHKSGGIMGGLFGHKDHHTGSSLGTTTSSSSHHKDTAPHVPVPVGAGMGSGLPGMVSSLLGTDMARGVAHNEGTLNQPPVVTNQPGTTGVFTQKKL